MEFPVAEKSAFICVDVQEKLLSVISGSEKILPRIKILLQAAKALNIPVVATCQYPERLGNTMSELLEIMPENTPEYGKLSFSCFGEESFREKVAPCRTLVLFGVETHVCVLQTALDAIRAGHEVILIEDAAGSRKESDKEAGIAFMKEAGVKIMTSEMLLFMYMRSSRHPSFKEVSKLIK
ncbi:MAG: isochorismatase family protein [Lentisphaeria bacterium]|nr:isochorismatase family protein [Lentisphaeria bacterium]MBO7328210.1 isochorismatase family protein [Lentisphaeria bacterium]